MKKRHLFWVALVYLGCTFSSCVSVSPVNAGFEKAATLGKGNLELMGNYTHYVASSDGESAVSNNNYGARVGYGLAKNFDLKVRYEKLVPALEEDRSDYKINYFSLIPKISIVERKLSFLLPLSRYNIKSHGGGETTRDHIYSIAPQFITTLTSKSNTSDLSFTLKGDYSIYSGDLGSDFFLGFNLGAGFSSDLNKWAIRPEAGYIFKPGQPGGWWSMGIGAQFILPLGKKTKS